MLARVVALVAFAAVFGGHAHIRFWPQPFNHNIKRDLRIFVAPEPSPRPIYVWNGDRREFARDDREVEREDDYDGDGA